MKTSEPPQPRTDLCQCESRNVLCLLSERNILVLPQCMCVVYFMHYITCFNMLPQWRQAKFALVIVLCWEMQQSCCMLSSLQASRSWIQTTFGTTDAFGLHSSPVVETESHYCGHSWQSPCTHLLIAEKAHFKRILSKDNTIMSNRQTTSLRHWTFTQTWPPSFSVHLWNTKQVQLQNGIEEFWQKVAS